MWKSRQAIETDLREIEEQAAVLRKSLAEYDRLERSRGSKTEKHNLRFYGTKPSAAMWIVLEENGGTMKDSELLAIIVHEGAMKTQEKPMMNAAKSLKMAIAHGRFIRVDRETVRLGTPKDPRVRTKTT